MELPISDLRITNLENCEYFPLKSVLNLASNLKIMYNITIATAWISIVAADKITTLDAIATYGWLSEHIRNHCFSTNIDAVLFVKKVSF